VVDDLSPEIEAIRGSFLSAELVTRHVHDAIDRSLVRHDGHKLADVLMKLA
jgi:hypothetical protein